LARIADIDSNSEEWNRCNQIALENARQHGDQIRLAYCLIEQALISSGDRVLARKLLLESLEIMDNLGSTEGYTSVLARISSLEVIRGEFSSAIENYLKVVSIQESLDSETGIPASMLSSLYNLIGEYESGLEWGRMSEDQRKNRPFLQPRAVMNQVWSLAMLNRITESELLLDTVHESILKSGREIHLGLLNFVTGIIELANGDATSAMSSIEESLKIFEAHEGVLRYRNMSLFYLAKIEVALADVNTEVLPYLALLEERAINEDLPGIIGLTLLLKADLALIHNDDSTLRDMVQRLGTLSQERGLSFLLPFVKKLMTRI